MDRYPGVLPGEVLCGLEDGLLADRLPGQGPGHAGREAVDERRDLQSVD
jgi:hypothetical protein